MAIAGWTLDKDAPSGASRRMHSLLHAISPLLEQGEQITVLHRPGQIPEDPPPGIRWQPIGIPAVPTWRRVRAERRLLAPALESMAANVLELGTLPVPRKLPCPVSLTLHDLRDLEGWRRRPQILVRHYLRQSMRRIQMVTVPSHFTEQTLRQAMGGLLPPIRIVPGGIAENFLHTERLPANGRPYLLCVSHLEARKNLIMLLSAYALFLEHYEGKIEDAPALYLLGADHGMRQKLFERAAILDVVGHVHFIEPVPEDELLDLYARASALLFPSLHEGFGLPILEALAMGLPVLISDRGALPEVAGDAGTVLPAEDNSAWARAMQTCLSPDGWEDARRARAAEFSWDIAGQDTLDHWREIAT